MNSFTITGQTQTSFIEWLLDGIRHTFIDYQYIYHTNSEDDINLVFHVVDRENPKPYRRKSQGTFVVSIVEADDTPEDIHREAYPYLVRSLANHLMYIVKTEKVITFYFLTPEQGRYSISFNKQEDDDSDLFKQIFNRLKPLASSKLVINNDFYEDLPEPLWQGDDVTESLRESGKKLDRLNLLPAPFPLEEVLTPRDIRHLKKLYGIGGLSYGNLSARKDDSHFWMSASGIDKSNMQHVGKDFLYISGYDIEKNAMKVSIPPKVTPKRASVDAIEHWMIYKEHPGVGAIVHIHAWMDGIDATEFNYPCGTVDLANSVAQLVKEAEDPTRAVIGLKNHGLTITGRNLEDIFERIDGKIIPQVPMQ
ncbi:class II aldolase/adducin family protein [Evansella halocellulosilytica]|uniref:class II aldolase/adducin family protein n=1 Tax=Evansella halocellulosilytica TaxID=2011013 RepID=UPI000BB94159|nr:class II aldolase/adducin family protein [Evansella halocellulosilytica]